MKSLLLVRLSALGDVVHALPALELLRAALPAARIGWAVESAAAPILRGHPGLDRLHVLERGGLGHERTRRATLASAVSFGREVRREGYEAALDLQGLARSALVARLASPRVLGPRHGRELAPWLYSERLAAPAPGEAHAVRRSLELVRLLLVREGIAEPVDVHAPRLVLGAGARAAAERALGEGPAPVVLLPGAGKPANRPPVGLLASVARRVASERPGTRFAIVGGPQDVSAGGRLARAVGAIDVTGELSIEESAAVLERAAVVLGGDTGPLHVARALGRPVVALFFAADPRRTGPPGFPGEASATVLRGSAPCAPCLARRCRRPDRVRICLDPLEASAVARAVLDALPATGVTA